MIKICTLFLVLKKQSWGKGERHNPDKMVVQEQISKVLTDVVKSCFSNKPDGKTMWAGNSVILKFDSFKLMSGTRNKGTK